MDSEVIDLTESFTLSDHRQLENLIIEVEDSPVPKITPGSKTSRRSQRVAARSTSNSRKTQPSAETIKQKEATTTNKQEDGSKGFGDCPICWDKLGNNTLASTKCGHVFCLQCIEQVARQTKRCPTCRCVLNGASAYHPLYISLQ